MKNSVVKVWQISHFSLTSGYWAEISPNINRNLIEKKFFFKPNQILLSKYYLNYKHYFFKYC